MQKTKAIELLGGSIKAAAAAVGVTYWAVYKWPDELPKRISDRVEAALSRLPKPKTSRKTKAVEGATNAV
jgi:hypothetical protein